MARIERSVHEALALHSPDSQIDILVRELAMTRIARACEAAWGIIFESQIRALQAIKQSNGELERADLEPIYNSVADMEEQFTFDHWAGYLLAPSTGLVEVGATGKLRTTELGDDFLEWLPNKGSLRRPY